MHAITDAPNHDIVDDPTPDGSYPERSSNAAEVVRLAAHLSAAPIAAIYRTAGQSLVLVASIGLPEADLAPCALDHEVLAAGTALIIDDLSAIGERASTLQRRGLHFYAGIPIVTSNGPIVGVLCILHTRPHTLSTSQHADLYAVARLFGAQSTPAPLPLPANAVPNASATTAPNGPNAHAELQHSFDLRERALAATNSGVVITDMRLPERPIIFCNPAFEQMTGYGPAETLGFNCRFLQGTDRGQPEIIEIRSALNEGRSTRVILRNYRKDGSLFYNDLSLSPVRDDQGTITHFIGVQNDVTDRRRAEQERARLQEEVIRVQAAALAELSSPLIPLSDQVLVLPLIGSMPSHRAEQVLETLLQGVSSQHARLVIIDITGVPTVDTEVAATLLRATSAVRLLGAGVFLTGVRPDVAQTMVSLGIDFTGIKTFQRLQQGVAYALERGMVGQDKRL
ncbi:MAG: hypothetical protein NVS4B8_02400 [Herpetosiphon sp.]